MSYAVEVEGARKTYGSGDAALEALRGVDFRVSAGEFVLLSGPSGSGKTTLLSIIGCVLSPSAGQVRLLGRDISRADEADLSLLRLRKIGFVFQSNNLIASLSCRDNVAMILELCGVPRAKACAEADAHLARVGVADQAGKKPRDLSGGQRQRVAIARALAGSPPLVLADEPTAALDARNGLAVTETLRALAKEHGHTVIVVTHDSRNLHLADRIVRIEDGRIVEEAS